MFITPSLKEEIFSVFRGESKEILTLLCTLEENPKKGKDVGAVGNIVIKELKYNKFRFYFITDRYKVRVLSTQELKDLLIKFVRMSEKKDQQDVINEIRRVLLNIGVEGF